MGGKALKCHTFGNRGGVVRIAATCDRAYYSIYNS